MNNQTKLVSHQHDLQENRTGVDELKTRKVILEQKKLRLNLNFEQNEKDIR